MTQDIRLLPYQLREILSAAAAIGLQPAALIVSQKASLLRGYEAYTHTHIQYDDTDFYLSIHLTVADEYEVSYSPGLTKRIETKKVKDWQEIFTLAQEWLECLVRDVKATEDIEALLAGVRGFGGQGPDINFNDTERTLLRQALDNFLEAVTTKYDLPSPDKDQLASDIEYLKEQLDLQTKRAWLNILKGAVISRILASETLSRNAADVLQLLYECLTHVPEMGRVLAPYLLTP